MTDPAEVIAALAPYRIRCVCLCGCGETWTRFDKRAGALYATDACAARVKRDHAWDGWRILSPSKGRVPGSGVVGPDQASRPTRRSPRPTKTRTERGVRVYLLPSELIALSRGSRGPAGKRAAAKLTAARRRLS